MIFDSLGLPRDNGATDWQDSARLAGLCVLFGFKDIPLEKYIKGGKYVRHPSEYKYDFSRDQAICLMAGLYAQGRHDLVSLKRVKGWDIFLPSQRGHERRCKGLKSTWLQDKWLWCDVWYSAKFKPLEESNQLIAMLKVADAKYLKWWLKNNKQWKKSITDYWTGWRDEKELCEKIITVLLEYA